MRTKHPEEIIDQLECYIIALHVTGRAACEESNPHSLQPVLNQLHNDAQDALTNLRHAQRVWAATARPQPKLSQSTSTTVSKDAKSV